VMPRASRKVMMATAMVKTFRFVVILLSKWAK